MPFGSTFPSTLTDLEEDEEDSVALYHSIAASGKDGSHSWCLQRVGASHSILVAPSSTELKVVVASPTP
jgi:hypothetical protein